MSGLLPILEDAVSRSVSGRRVAVAFSGGIDSSLVAYLAGRHADSVSLYVAGFEGSHDIEAARSAAEALGMELRVVPMDDASVEGMLSVMVSVTGTTDPVMLSFEMPLAHVLAACEEDFVVGGQGADEAFAGYSRFEGMDPGDFMSARQEAIDKLMGPTMSHESKMSAHFGKTILYPFTDPTVMSYAGSLGPEGLMPRDGLRKHALREMAEEVLPIVAARRKKAAQYGSGAMASMRRIAKARGSSVEELIIASLNG